MTMHRLYASQNTIFLQQLAEDLAQAGIETHQRNMNMTGQAAGELPPIVCWPEIWVRHEADLAQARELLRKRLASMNAPGENWQCPVCGETLEGQFGSCWKCAGEQPEM